MSLVDPIIPPPVTLRGFYLTASVVVEAQTNGANWESVETTFVSDQMLTLIFPPHVAGTVNVRVVVGGRTAYGKFIYR